MNKEKGEENSTTKEPFYEPCIGKSQAKAHPWNEPSAFLQGANERLHDLLGEKPSFLFMELGWSSSLSPPDESVHVSISP
jgi:hypothetical protein